MSRRSRHRRRSRCASLQRRACSWSGSPATGAIPSTPARALTRRAQVPRLAAFPEIAMAARSAHPPLSERLPAILAYPARSPTLWLIGALALLRLLHHLPNILGLLFESAFWFIAFKLAVEALRNT